jgi:hypothetical protein
MGLAPFILRFPELGEAETRHLHTRNHPVLPDGRYGFVELFCDDPQCDCRRAMINVYDDSVPMRHLATINYGWESLDFYIKWMHGNVARAQEAQGAWLDPLNPQSVYSDELLEQFRMMLEDRAYAARIQRHYEIFKASLPKPHVHGKKRMPRKLRPGRRR